MPYMTQRFQPLDLAQVSPLGYGLSQIGPGINRGAELYNQILNSQLNKFAIEQKKAEEPYYGDIAKAKLLEAQLGPKELQARINLISAQQNQLNKFLPYDIENKKAEAALHQVEANKVKLISDLINGNSSDNANSGAQSEEKNNSNVSQLSNYESTTGNYGVPDPIMTKDDKINKVGFGIDTYSSKLQNAIAQRGVKQKMYVDEMNKANNQLQDMMEGKNLLNRYMSTADQLTVSGKARDYFPFSHWTSQGQQLQNIVSQFNNTSIAKMRDAMGTVRFSNLDMTMALKQSPQENWNKGARDEYANFYDAVQKRLQQYTKFLNVANALKIDPQYIKPLWNQYQNQYPITGYNKKGKQIVLPKQSDNWQKYLSPEAVNSVMKTGSYSPISQKHITSENVSDTMKSTGLSKKEVLNELESRGYDISGVK